MKSETPKVLHSIGGRSLLGHAIAAAAGLRPDRLVVVVGPDSAAVAEHAQAAAPGTVIAVQPKPLGTGDAVRSALDELPDLEGSVLVTYGDVPLQTSETLQQPARVPHARREWADDSDGERRRPVRLRPDRP